MVETRDIEKMIRSDLITFAGYSGGMAPEAIADKVEVPIEDIIKLNANENPYGCSPRVNKALANYAHLNIYPDDKQVRLRKLIAGYAGTKPECVIASNGGNQLIDMLIHLFVEPGDEVITCSPAFSMFRFSTELCRGKLIEVPRDENFKSSVDAVKAAISKKTKIILLDNPNNPSGNVTAQSDILKLLDLGLPLLVDEAYYEFYGQTVVPLVKQYRNLLVTRTFSKWAGLAGLRIGYGIFTPRIVNYLLAIKQPFNVNVAAQIAVEESLKDIDYLKNNVNAIIAERERLFKELSKFEYLKPFPSGANYILCFVQNGGKQLFQYLESKGIMIRYFDQPRLKDYVRISAGKPEQTDALIKALRIYGGK